MAAARRVGRSEQLTSVEKGKEETRELGAEGVGVNGLQ